MDTRTSCSFPPDRSSTGRPQAGTWNSIIVTKLSFHIVPLEDGAGAGTRLGQSQIEVTGVKEGFCRHCWEGQSLVEDKISGDTVEFPKRQVLHLVLLEAGRAGTVDGGHCGVGVCQPLHQPLYLAVTVKCVAPEVQVTQDVQGTKDVSGQCLEVIVGQREVCQGLQSSEGKLGETPDIIVFYEAGKNENLS